MASYPSSLLIAIDFETTGLNPRFSSIIEVGAVKFSEEGDVIDTFEMLANPNGLIPRDAEAIHGISRDMVQSCPSPEEVWAEFLRWSAGVAVFVAHNAAFEASFIRALYENQSDIPAFCFIDTLELSRKRLPARAGYKLTDLVEKFDGPIHRALPDAKACFQLYMTLSATYKSGKVPTKTYIRSMSDFEERDRPTERQLRFIASLGGDPSSVRTKSQASSYIDRLKVSEVSSNELRPVDFKSKPGFLSPHDLFLTDTFVVIAILLVLGLTLFW